MALVLRMTITSLILAAMMFAHQAVSMDIPGERIKVAITDAHAGPYKEISVSASLDEGAGVLASLEVSLDGNRVGIPQKAFNDLPKPNLRSLELLYSGREISDPDWYVIVRIEYGDPRTPERFDEDTENRDRFSSVEIMIKQGKALGRFVFRAEQGGSSSFEKF